MGDPAKNDWEHRATEVPMNEVYRFFSNQWLHQDQLGWSRIQTIVAVEGASLGAAFVTLRILDGWISFSLLLFSTAIIFILWRLVEIDWLDRNHARAILDRVHQPLELRIQPERKGRLLERGGKLLDVAMILIVLANTALAIVAMSRPNF